MSSALGPSRRAVPFARHLLGHRKSRTAVATAGITFAVLVLFMQLGFYGSVVRTSVAVSDRLDADLLLVSPRFVHLNETQPIDRARAYQAFAVPEVTETIPVFVRNARLRNPATGEGCRMMALGLPISEALRYRPLRLEGVMEGFRALEATGTLLVDRLTQPECGTDSLGDTEIRDQTARLVGHYSLGVGFLGDGSLIMSDDTFSQLFGGHRLDRPQIVLIRLEAGADRDRVATRLREALPRDVNVITAEQLRRLQQRFWVENTAVGNMFTMGAIAGFFVGLAVLYQILSIDVRNALPLYATLKAMGYGDRRLQGFVVQQSWWFAILGFVPALLATLALFPIIHRLTLLPIAVTPTLAAGVFLLSLAMCTSAGVLSARKLRSADPAELF